MGGQRHFLATLPQGKKPVTHCTRRWAAGPVWAGAENLVPTEIRSPDRQAHSESVYRLRYPGPHAKCKGREAGVVCFGGLLRKVSGSSQKKNMKNVI